MLPPINSNQQNIMHEANQATPPSKIRNDIDELIERISHLANVIDRLDGATTPIQSPPAPSLGGADVCKDDRANSSPLANDLHDINMRVGISIERIEVIIESLEI